MAGKTNQKKETEKSDVTTRKSEQAKREERILEFWEKNNIFEKTLEQTKAGKKFVFYEGPPTANGMPGIHHLEARSFKDAIPRYKTMRGFYVRRKGGWDTHGLPVELQVEKKLGLSSKKAIEEYGIAKFNQECKESVWEYLDVWMKFTKRMGYWVDEKNAYVTYHNEYIESVWHILKEINKQKLLYKDYKVLPWCPRCGTALSSHELAQGYEEIKDLSVYVKFKVVGRENTYLLAWTTTPWTLPGNVALAVGADIDYVKISKEGGEEFLILAKDRLPIIEGSYKIINEMKGKDLVEFDYEPLFPYLKEHVEKKGESAEKMFKVYSADFVNTEDGTGIVHTAVMYGQDDFVLGTSLGLPKYHLVNPEGKFIKNTGFLEGRFVRETNEDGKPTLAVDIIEDLKKRNLFFKQENYKHSYPHCWRCKTALIYYARDSWYIRMSSPKVKAKLISENEKINWEPKHIREGRFGQWLEEIKDWAISRERYWGTPLPLWQCASCNKVHVVGSIEELKNKTKKSGNKYFVMRHGGTESNAKGTISFKKEKDDHLTKEGRKQTESTAESLVNKKIDLIISSPFTRTRETTEILAKKLGLGGGQIVFDDRLHELDAGIFDGDDWAKYHAYVMEAEHRWFSHKIPEGESLKDVARRTGAVLYELENKYKDKNILIVTHGGPAWLLFVNSGLHLPDNKPYEVPNAISFVADFKTFDNAEVRPLPFIPISHNADYEMDLHRPFIDEVALVCDCGENLVRTKEVMDVWFDSGAMPFAQDHFPFEQKIKYPADFISEGVDQTRGWFYTLHAIGILMGRGKAYKNVICLGLLMDAFGKKMSKSVGNVVEPFEAIQKYGVDTLRLWMYSVNQPGESKNFDEKTIGLLHSQFFGLLYNVLAFYELYPLGGEDRRRASYKTLKPKNILDQWILARLDELIGETTENLDKYKLLEPTRAMRDFIGDLSTWYLRRSRGRLKDEDMEARATLYVVLKTLARLMAPLAPFTAEDIWIRLRSSHDKESVHLASWPSIKNRRGLFGFLRSSLGFGRPEVLEKMETVRSIVTLGLEARQNAGIKVRQPLHKLEIIAESLPAPYIEIIKEELNIKNVDYLLKIKLGITKVTLDTHITEELKQEGDYRELARALQDMRKNLGLTPSEAVNISLETSNAGKKLIQKFESDMKKTVMVSKIEFRNNDGEEIKIDDLVFKAKISKI